MRLLSAWWQAGMERARGIDTKVGGGRVRTQTADIRRVTRQQQTDNV